MSDENIVASVNLKNERFAWAEALEIALPALEREKEDYSLWIAAGNAYYGLKRFDEAENAYLTAADLNPQDVIALSNLAGVYFETGRFTDGLSVCERALERCPDYANVFIHQGNMFSSLNRFDEAARAYGKALELTPDDLLASFNLAYAFSMAGRVDEAEAVYLKLLEVRPADSEYLFAYASLLEKKEDFETASDIYLRLLKVEDTPTTHIALGGCLYNLLLAGGEDDVWRLTDAWLAAFPDNPIARHSFQTLKNSRDVTRASAEYVQELFDAFADSFDSVLEGLSYQAPSLIASAVRKLPFDTLPAVLDLGCGTGLCADALQRGGAAFASLTGVDLSPAMLEKAKRRKIYTELVQSDILSFLPAHSNAFDLIVSADVFTYLGDLSALFAGVARALKAGGKAVFTVSENRNDPDAYALEPSGRFMHGKNYVLNRLEENGLTVSAIENVELRQELGQPVYGLLVTGVRKINT